MSSLIKTYSELITIPKYLDRFEYLKLSGVTGTDDPEVLRWLHQIFYHSKEWHKVRDEVIVRDSGYDLAHPDYVIGGKVVVHHINPVKMKDIADKHLDILLNPENLVCCSFMTHQAIHYGTDDLLMKDPVSRSPGDTKLW